MIEQNVRPDTSDQTGSGKASCETWFGCGSPPLLAANTGAKRRADQILPRGAAECVYFLVVAALASAGAQVPGWAGLTMISVAALAGGGWCGINFWRCRHAHCLITATGWLTLAAVAAAGAAAGHSLIAGREGIVFLAILAAGILFELGWYLTRGSHAIAHR